MRSRSNLQTIIIIKLVAMVVISTVIALYQVKLIANDYKIR